jgi:deferrochelatase/peroxidase EfeB
MRASRAVQSCYCTAELALVTICILTSRRNILLTLLDGDFGARPGSRPRAAFMNVVDGTGNPKGEQDILVRMHEEQVDAMWRPDGAHLAPCADNGDPHRHAPCQIERKLKGFISVGSME